MAILCKKFNSKKYHNKPFIDKHAEVKKTNKTLRNLDYQK